MFASVNHLPEKARAQIAGDLNSVLADGLDLYSQVKTAHWNVKGPHFAALHPLFDTFAQSITEHDDEIAERAVALGALALGTVRRAARTSRIPDYPQETTRDLEHVALLVERFEKFLEGLRAARSTAESHDDADTVDLLTGIITEFEKHGWFLRATLEGTAIRGEERQPVAHGAHEKRGAAARA